MRLLSQRLALNEGNTDSNATAAASDQRNKREMRTGLASRFRRLMVNRREKGGGEEGVVKRRCGFVTPLWDMKLTPRHVEPIAWVSQNGQQEKPEKGPSAGTQFEAIMGFELHFERR